MPNMPDVNKKLIGVRISLETYYKLLRLAGGSPAKVAEVIRAIVAARVEPIELTLEERQAIIEEVMRNQRKRMGGLK